MHKLEAKNIKKHFKKHTALGGVSVHFDSGEIVSLLGPNGAGKTTLFYSICGLVEVDEGAVILDGKDITELPLHQKARIGLGYLPQESSVFKDLSVEENIELACEVIYKNEDEIMQNTDRLLEMLSIEPIRTRPAYALSGGERRRVEIARALAANPQFLLLDEPFAGVDPLAVSEIQKIIIELKNNGIGIIITDHNFREALEISDRAYVLGRGMLLAEGTPAEIYESEIVKRHYLG
ncbi:MAG TPA: LPS export ABC transporter ATP-binding protein, partial [Campylobacterales bacterium]|nr:LPS export ABC transporter ATP-binding protein [Campylobacterales bacterium]